MSDLYVRFDAVFFEKTRLSMLTLLYREGALSFNALRDALGATDGAAYTHLGKLKEAGYLGAAKQLVGGTVNTMYELTPEGRQAFRDYLAFLEEQVKRHSMPEENR